MHSGDWSVFIAECVSVWVGVFGVLQLPTSLWCRASTVNQQPSNQCSPKWKRVGLRQRGYKQVSDTTGQRQKQKEYLSRKMQWASTPYPQRRILRISETFSTAFSITSNVLCSKKKASESYAGEVHCASKITPTASKKPSQCHKSVKPKWTDIILSALSSLTAVPPKWKWEREKKMCDKIHDNFSSFTLLIHF